MLDRDEDHTVSGNNSGDNSFPPSLPSCVLKPSVFVRYLTLDLTVVLTVECLYFDRIPPMS